MLLHSSSDLYGSDRSLLKTCDILIRSNYICHIILPEYGPLVQKLEDIGCKVNIMNIAILRRRLFILKEILIFPIHWILSEFKIFKLIMREKIHIIHINTTAVVSGQISGWLLKKVIFQHVREIIIKPAIIAKTLSLYNKLFSTVIFAVSGPVKNHLNTQISIFNKKVTVLPNGLDLNHFKNACREKDNPYENNNIPQNCIKIACVGRIHFWKGQDYLIDSLKLIKKMNIDYRLIIAGDSYPGYEHLQKRLVEKVEKHGLQYRVLFLGFINNIPNFLKYSDIFVLPSILPDPLPGVVLEAMAAKLPVISINHGGAIEMVIPDKTGILVPPNNKYELSKAIAKLILNDNLRKNMGLAGFKHLCNHYTLQKYNVNILKFYKKYNNIS